MSKEKSMQIKNSYKDQYRKNKLNEFTKKETFGVLLIFLVLTTLLTIFRRESFLTVNNLASVGRGFSYIAIMALGMTFVIITGGIDLSVGSVFGLAGILAALTVAEYEQPIYLGILIGIVTGTLIGFINGYLITKAYLPPFIATLGMMSVSRGLAQGLSSGVPIRMPSGFNLIGQGEIYQIPFMVIYLIVLALIFGFILKKTVFGRRVLAIGGSEEASRYSGIDVNRTKIFVYMISGFLSAIAGIIITARLGVAQSSSGTGYELDVIAAVIIGGTSMSGGKGTIFGAILGAAIMGVLRNGLILLDISGYWQQAIIGIVIIVAVTADQMRYRRKKNWLQNIFHLGKLSK